MPADVEPTLRPEIAEIRLLYVAALETNEVRNCATLVEKLSP